MKHIIYIFGIILLLAGFNTGLDSAETNSIAGAIFGIFLILFGGFIVVVSFKE